MLILGPEITNNFSKKRNGKKYLIKAINLGNIKIVFILLKKIIIIYIKLSKKNCLEMRLWGVDFKTLLDFRLKSIFSNKSL